MVDRALFETKLLFFIRQPGGSAAWERTGLIASVVSLCFDRLSLEEPSALIGKADRGNELRDVKKHTGQAVCGWGC